MFKRIIYWEKIKDDCMYRWKVVTEDKWDENIAKKFQTSVGYNHLAFGFFDFKVNSDLNKKNIYEWISYSITD